MKYLEKYQLITLDDNKEYVVIGSIVYENDNYGYLVSKDNLKDQLLVLASKENEELIIDVIDQDNESNKDMVEKISKIIIEDVINNMSGGILGNE